MRDVGGKKIKRVKLDVLVMLAISAEICFCHGKGVCDWVDVVLMDVSHSTSSTGYSIVQTGCILCNM